MTPKLLAFDLDGTLLTSSKTLSPANERALHDMVACGIHVAFASGRLGSSMLKYVPVELDDIAMVTLNGGLVYSGKKHGTQCIYSASLPSQYADYLIDYAHDHDLALNYYIDGLLYAARTEQTRPWFDLYFSQTGTAYQYKETLLEFRGKDPHKTIIVADKAVLDREEAFFRDLWPQGVYICRTWHHYLEFLNPRATKAYGLEALAAFYGITMADVVAFGDADNDIPLLRAAGLGIAMANAEEQVKNAADRVLPWSNDDDGIARAWELLKKEF